MGVVLTIVLMFALISAVAEVVAMGMFLGPRARGLLLGNEALKKWIHLFMFVVNLWMHWGGVSGTTSALLALCMSPIAMWFARKLFGYFENDPHFVHGWIKYSARQLLNDEQYIAYITRIINTSVRERSQFDQNELDMCELEMAHA